MLQIWIVSHQGLAIAFPFKVANKQPRIKLPVHAGAAD